MRARLRGLVGSCLFITGYLAIGLAVNHGFTGWAA